ncbi:MAG: putative toxin-antitoxin system toxin component, PIN family [Actinomycetota bacterium]
MRAVLDPNVIISALLSPDGAPARTVRGWLHGQFELVVSPLLLEELGRALNYPKLRKRIEPEEAGRFIDWLGTAANMATDPVDPASIRSPDPSDDYVIALAQAEQALLVSGDQHLLGLAEDLPIFSPVGFLDVLAQGGGSEGR